MYFSFYRDILYFYKIKTTSKPPKINTLPSTHQQKFILWSFKFYLYSIASTQILRAYCMPFLTSIPALPSLIYWFMHSRSPHKSQTLSHSIHFYIWEYLIAEVPIINQHFWDLSINVWLHFAFPLTQTQYLIDKCWWSSPPNWALDSIMRPCYTLLYYFSLAPETLIQGNYFIGTYLYSHAGY